MDNEKQEELEQSKTDINTQAKGLFNQIYDFMHELLDIRSETDRYQTITEIKEEISFKGHTAWILIFAVFIASIGLNVSSTAVVIGAMLISPLMGPILGIGISLATYDIDTLKRSFINLGVMVGLSVLTAWLYFEMSPLTELTPELESRTAPTILDVLVAIFGGLALIVAKSKKGKMASVIFGVAIATALMPPLCTVGYGLAVWEPKFFLGAMYLFVINTIFIALTAFSVAKVLNFPLMQYANARRKNRIKWTVIGVALFAIIPAIYTFYNVWQETSFNSDAKAFILNEVKSNEALILLDDKDYSFETQEIHLSFYNNITDETKYDLLSEIKKYEHLQGAELKIKGSNTKSYELVEDLLNEKRDEVKIQRDKISVLESEILTLKNDLKISNKAPTVDYLMLSKDAKINFSGLESISFSKELNSNFKQLDTLNVVARPKWTNTPDSLIAGKNSILSEWLMKKIKTDTVFVR